MKVSDLLKQPKIKLVVGREYEVHQKYATLEAIEGSSVVMRDRWENRFECDPNDLQEKKISARRKLDAKEISKGRSEGYWEMNPDDQWAEDKRLGILDWDGN